MNMDHTILVVEDDEDDFFLTERVLRRLSATRVRHVENGRDAIAYLLGSGAFSNREEFPLPDIVLLDLKMAPVSGLEVLEAVKAQPPQPMPHIFVLTGSNEPKDREAVKHSGAAAGYIVKPLSPEHVKAIFTAVEAGSPASI